MMLPLAGMSAAVHHHCNPCGWHVTLGIVTGLPNTAYDTQVASWWHQHV